MSADMCTGLIKNVISHSDCFKGSGVFGCFLDASKAFDRVSHLKLFNRLLEKNLPPTIIRLLFSWYKDQKSSVLWYKTLSEKFSVSNGVRQGGVLSPILFIGYIDELLIRLQSQAVGCHWSHCFAGAFGYTDGIVLWLPLPQHCEWRWILVASLLLIITSPLIQEKHSLFGSHYQGLHPVQLLYQSLIVFKGQSHTGGQSLPSGSYLAFWSIWCWWYSEGSNWHVPQSQLPFIYLFSH